MHETWYQILPQNMQEEGPSPVHNEMIAIYILQDEVTKDKQYSAIENKLSSSNSHRLLCIITGAHYTIHMVKV